MHDIYIYIYIYIYIFFLHFYACFLYYWKPSVYPIFSQSYISIPSEISEKRKEHINATLTTARNIANVKKIYWYVFVTGKFFFFFFFEVVQNPVQEVINHTDECFDWTYYFVLLRQLQTKLFDLKRYIKTMKKRLSTQHGTLTSLTECASSDWNQGSVSYCKSKDMFCLYCLC